MTAADTVREYYEALRRGEPLSPYFAEESSTVKFGVSERLTGYEEVAEGLREQTHTTRDWTVESRRLRVTERDCHAWFSDDVRLAWTADAGERRDFETRWSATLEERDGWAFVGMHVSVAHPLDRTPETR